MATSLTTHKRKVFYAADAAADALALLLLPRKESAERKAFPVAARTANDGRSDHTVRIRRLLATLKM